MTKKVDVFITEWTAMPSSTYLQRLAERIGSHYPISAHRLRKLGRRVDNLCQEVNAQLALVGEMDDLAKEDNDGNRA